jgi:hypothetical protein
MNLKEIGCKSLDWIQLARDRILWKPFMDTVMNRAISWPSERLSASQVLLIVDLE